MRILPQYKLRVLIAISLLTPDGPGGVWIYGETEWANRNLYAGAGRQLLRPSTLDFLDAHALVGATPARLAEAVAGNVMEAAIRTAKIAPPPSGIGGDLRLVVVDARGVMPLQPKP